MAPLALGQDWKPTESRQLKIPGTAGEPGLVLNISANGRLGLVSVRSEKGAELQRLECPLQRDNVGSTPGELAAVREHFVSQFVSADFDSDGWPDLAGVREFGAKWARYCVWLYDAKQHRFIKDFLAEQMELLTNLEPLRDGLVSSSRMGPANPWRARYRVTGAPGSRPERQLLPISSCLVETMPGGEKPTALVLTRFENGRAVVQQQDAGKMEMKAALAQCDSADVQAR